MATVSRTAGAANSVTVTIKNTAGQLVTPVSTPTVVWYTDSDRTLGATSLTVSGAGSTYTASWTALQAPATPATRYLKVTIEVSSGVFDTDTDDDISFVDASSTITGGLCTLTEVKTHLKKDLNVTTDDAQLTNWISSVTTTVEAICGPMVPRTVTDPPTYVNGSALTLKKRPVVSITSVTEYTGSSGQAYTVISSPASAGAYTVMLENDRTIRRRDASGPASFSGELVVTYVAGRSPIPDAINRAAILIVAHLWKTRYGGTTPPNAADDPLTESEGFHYAIPTRAHDLLQPYRQGLRIA